MVNMFVHSLHGTYQLRMHHLLLITRLVCSVWEFTETMQSNHSMGYLTENINFSSMCSFSKSSVPVLELPSLST